MSLEICHNWAPLCYVTGDLSQLGTVMLCNGRFVTIGHRYVMSREFSHMQMLPPNHVVLYTLRCFSDGCP